MLWYASRFMAGLSGQLSYFLRRDELMQGGDTRIRIRGKILLFVASSDHGPIVLRRDLTSRWYQWVMSAHSYPPSLSSEKTSSHSWSIVWTIWTSRYFDVKCDPVRPIHDDAVAFFHLLYFFFIAFFFFYFFSSSSKSFSPFPFSFFKRLQTLQRILVEPFPRSIIKKTKTKIQIKKV